MKWFRTVQALGVMMEAIDSINVLNHRSESNTAKTRFSQLFIQNVAFFMKLTSIDKKA